MSGIYELGFTGVYVGVLYIPTPKGSIAGVVINFVMVFLWICLLIYHLIIYIQVIFLFRRENYYLRKLGTIIKDAFCNTIKGAVKKSVEVKMHKKSQIAVINCRVCASEYKMEFNHLTAPIDVYYEWIDKSEEVNR